MKRYKIAFACCSRADYGIVRNYLSLLCKEQSVELKILVTGSLTKYEYNHTVDLIKTDGFDVAVEIDLPLKNTTNLNIINAMSICLRKFGHYFYNNKYDLLIILGDRYEMLPISIAASMQRIPILHIHGGEATFGNYDEFIRHSITKMSLFHITSTKKYRNRVIQLGENPNRVYCLGSLGAENCKKINTENVPLEIKKIKQKTYFVVLFNPETITGDDTKKQVEILLNSIKKYNEFEFYFIGSNSDTNSNIIRNKIYNYTKNKNNAHYIENLHPDAYHYLLKNSNGLIGNSSSGIIEAPSFGIFSINIGQRQDGREKGKTVLDVNWDETEITKAIEFSLKNEAKVDNLYYKKNAAFNYYKKTVNIVKNMEKYIAKPKKFYDLISTEEKL